MNARRRRRQHRLGAAADPGLRHRRRRWPRTSWRTATPTARSAPARRSRSGPARPEGVRAVRRLPAHPRRRRPAGRLQRAPRGVPGGPADPRRRPAPTSTTLIGNSAALRALQPADFVDDTFGLPTVTDILARAGEAGPRPAPGVQDRDLRRGRREDRRPAARACCWRAWSPTWPRSARSSTSACTRTAWCTSRRCRKTFVKDPRDVVKSGRHRAGQGARRRHPAQAHLADPAAGRRAGPAEAARGRPPGPAAAGRRRSARRAARRRPARQGQGGGGQRARAAVARVAVARVSGARAVAAAAGRRRRSASGRRRSGPGRRRSASGRRRSAPGRRRSGQRQRSAPAAAPVNDEMAAALRRAGLIKD